MKYEVKYGMYISICCGAWLYGEYLIGLHDKYIDIFPYITPIALLVPILGIHFALRKVKQKTKQFSYMRGLKSGAIIALIAGVGTGIFQYIYHLLINPGWTEFMTQKTREMLISQGKNGEELVTGVENARIYFGTTSYVLQSSLSILVIILLITSVSMIFLREKNPSS